MVSNNPGSDNRIDREHNKEVLLAEKIIAAAQDKLSEVCGLWTLLFLRLREFVLETQL